MSMNLTEAKQILGDVKFPGYTFRISGAFDIHQPTYLQGVFLAPCNDEPNVTRPQHTRKWLLSQHMTRSELVQTAFKCALTSIEHEAREQFTYKGARIFGPHFNVEALVSVCHSAGLDVRGDVA